MTVSAVQLLPSRVVVMDDELKHESEPAKGEGLRCAQFRRFISAKSAQGSLASATCFIESVALRLPPTTSRLPILFLQISSKRSDSKINYFPNMIPCSVLFTPFLSHSFNALFCIRSVTFLQGPTTCTSRARASCSQPAGNAALWSLFVSNEERTCHQPNSY